MVLQGYGLTIDVVGDTLIKDGVTSSTLKTVPDQPVTSFELELPEKQDPALTADGNLCALTHTVAVKKKVTVRVHGRRRKVTRSIREARPEALVMPTEFVAQNGAEIKQDTPISVIGCPPTRSKAVHKTKAKHRKKHGKG
jgi:hypothetical protein